MGKRLKDLTGQTFGRLTVIRFSHYESQKGEQGGRSYFLCKCLCGTERAFQGHNLSQGNIKSCGCIGKEKLVLRNTTHSGSRMPEYASYAKAKDRCTNPKEKHYLDYGGRGIEFRFTSFEEFLKHVGTKPSSAHSIDRKDNNGHYEIGNVKWSTRKEQANNRRKRDVQRLHEDLLTAYAKQVMGEL